MDPKYVALQFYHYFILGWIIWSCVFQFLSELPGIQLEDPQPAIPPAKPSIDYSYEASEYQRQLVQVSQDSLFVMEKKGQLQ